MRCPFLEESWVRFCELEPNRRIPISSPAEPVQDRCAHEAWRECSLLHERDLARSDAKTCPHYRTSLVQSCQAASMPRKIPYNDSLLSRCQSESHHWCPIYRERECPTEDGGPAPLPGRGRMWHARNHMWMHEGEFGLCHVGLDAFATRLLGEVDALQYPQSHGIGRPTVVATVEDSEFTFEFPERVELLVGNTHLTRDRRALRRDPYGAGWLFEARRLRLTAVPEPNERLLTDDEFEDWCGAEERRLLEFVHEDILALVPETAGLAADGGLPREDLLRRLDRRARERVHRRFFDLNSRQEA